MKTDPKPNETNRTIGIEPTERIQDLGGQGTVENRKTGDWARKNTAKEWWNHRDGDILGSLPELLLEVFLGSMLCTVLNSCIRFHTLQTHFLFCLFIYFGFCNQRSHFFYVIFNRKCGIKDWRSMRKNSKERKLKNNLSFKNLCSRCFYAINFVNFVFLAAV